MEDIKTNVEEESLELVDEPASKMGNDELKQAIEERMTQLRRQSMLLGAQAMCRVVLNKIYEHQTKPGKKTYRDYERLVNDIQQFCETGLSRKVDLDGETSSVDEQE